MIVDDVLSALPEMRSMAESLMVDACELRGPDVKGALDLVTRKYPLTPGALRYAGKAKVQTTDTIGNATDAAERAVMKTRFEVHIPMSAPAASVDDVITITASVLDPQLAGRRFRVVS